MNDVHFPRVQTIFVAMLCFSNKDELLSYCKIPSFLFFVCWTCHCKYLYKHRYFSGLGSLTSLTFRVRDLQPSRTRKTSKCCGSVRRLATSTTRHWIGRGRRSGKRRGLDGFGVVWGHWKMLTKLWGRNMAKIQNIARTHEASWIFFPILRFWTAPVGCDVCKLHYNYESGALFVWASALPKHIMLALAKAHLQGPWGET